MDENKRFSEQQALLEEVGAMLRAEVMQLCAKQQSAAVSKAMHTAAEKMDVRELLRFKQELTAEQTGTAQVQLCASGETEAFRC